MVGERAKSQVGSLLGELHIFDLAFSLLPNLSFECQFHFCVNYLIQDSIAFSTSKKIEANQERKRKGGIQPLTVGRLDGGRERRNLKKACKTENIFKAIFAYHKKAYASHFTKLALSAFEI